MCGSAPKPKKVEEKEPQYMRNPWLDGLAIGGLTGIRTGRNSLRVDLGGTNQRTGLGLGGRPLTPATAPASGAYPMPALTGFDPAAGSLAIGGGGARGNRSTLR